MHTTLRALAMFGFLTAMNQVHANSLLIVDLAPGESPAKVAGAHRWLGLGSKLVLEPHGPVAPALARRAREVTVPEGSYLSLVMSKHAPFQGNVLARHSGIALAALELGTKPPSDTETLVEPVPWNTTVIEPYEGRRSAKPANPAVEAAVASVSADAIRADVQKLVDFKTRHSPSQGYKDSVAWCEAQFRALGLATRRAPFTLGGGRACENLIAELPGQPGVQDIYVVGGHLDSVSFQNNANAPGADDNASGSACVIAIARAFAKAKPRATIRFMLFGGEEQGLVGSRAYVAGLSAAEKARHKGAITLDMTGFKKGAQAGVLLEGREISSALFDATADGCARYTTLKVDRSLKAWGSDHVPFLDAGIPAILTIELDYPDNGLEHGPRDTMDRVDAEQAAAIARADVSALATLAGF